MIYIYAPYYVDSSNGVGLLYELALYLNEANIETKVLCYEKEHYECKLPEQYKSFYISLAACPEMLKEDDIVLYPDVCSGNKLQAKHVIRWFLNKPSVLTGLDYIYDKQDYFLSYSNLVCKECPQLFIQKDERSLFSEIKKTSSKKVDAVSVYFGKVKIKEVIKLKDKLSKILEHYNTIHVITRSTPSSRFQMLRELAESDLLVSFDSLSNTNYEATLLGTPVLMMSDDYDIQNTLYNGGNYGLAFSEDSIMQARDEVALAFEAYCSCLSSQREHAIQVIKQAIHTLKSAEQDSKALEKNGLLNDRIIENFHSHYDIRSDSPYVNIYYPDVLPYSIRRILRLSENNCEQLPAVNNKSQKSLKNLIHSYYLIVKPRWVNESWEKSPKDLKMKELMYFAVRRLFIH